MHRREARRDGFVKPFITFAVLGLGIVLAATPLSAFAESSMTRPGVARTSSTGSQAKAAAMPRPSVSPPISSPQPLTPEAPYAALLPLSALVVVVHAGLLLAIRRNSGSAPGSVDGD
jgi:hypothetical protein